MIGTTLVASMLLAQALIEDVVVEGSRDRVDVGYAELVQGRPHAAIERIDANRELERDDPAALINLGTASARLGKFKTARDFYVSALASTARYDLELADGRWVDSRQAARMAIHYLEDGKMLALR